MIDHNHYDKTFEGIDYTQSSLPPGEYEQCHFANCLFSNMNFSNLRFIECKFEQCDWSMGIFTDTAIQACTFVNSKLLGLHFEACSSFLFAANFDRCNLSFTSFYQWDARQCEFKDCILQEVDFTGTNLERVQLLRCSLEDAIFEQTNLESADLRSSSSYRIDPENNRIQGAHFSLEGVVGLLTKHNIHIE